MPAKPTRPGDLLKADTQAIAVADLVEEGVEACRRGDWEQGLALLWKVARKDEPQQKLPSLYFSYAGYGAARFDKRWKEGLRLCRYAIKLDAFQPENYLNLARVYLLRRQRKKAVAALEKGLRLDSRNPHLVEFRRTIGYRRRPVIPFLPRGSALNRWLGQRRHDRLEERGEL